MPSLSAFARLFARAISGTEAENILFHSLIRLSSSSAVHLTHSATHRLAITHSSPAIRRAVHLVTASSGYSSRDNDEKLKIQQTDSYGDDAFFVTKHRIGDFLGE